MRHYVAIQIAGICNHAGTPIIFSSGDDAAHYSIFSNSAEYDLRAGQILSLSAFSEAIEDGASVATSGVTSLVLPADDRSLIGDRPIDIFARLGAESLSADKVWATHTVTAGASSISLSAGVAQTLPLPVLHIGTEAVISATLNMPDAGAINVTRGALGTLAMPHRANLTGFLARTIPVTTVPVEWIGRRVYVFVDNSLWRTMMLCDNPSVTASEITLSMVDVVNQLSLAKKTGQAPNNATTLASGLSSPLEFDLFQSRPAVSVGFKAASAMITTPGSFSANGAFTGGTSVARQRLLYLFGWWQKNGGWDYRYGSSGLPPLTFHLTALPAGDIAGTEYDLQMTGGAGAASLNTETTCYLGPAAPGQALDDFLSEGSSRQFFLMRASFGPSTYWADAGLAYLGQSADWPGLATWNLESGYHSAFSVSFTADGRLSIVSRASPQAGYINWSAFVNPLIVGTIYRRNLGEGESAKEIRTGRNLLEGLYADWDSSADINGTTSGPINPAIGDDPDYVHTFYAVRPKTDGDVHNVIVTPKNVVCVLDGYGWPRDRASASLDVDYCEPGQWWEPGVYSISVLAQLPLFDGTSGQIEIRWQEPDEVWRRAVADVSYINTSSGRYSYRLTKAAMIDGSPCVGFGTWHGFEPCQILPPTFLNSSFLGILLSAVIASTDATSGRRSDRLGDGFGVALSSGGFLSLLDVVPAGLAGTYRFAADEELSANDFIDLACRLSGFSVVGRLDPAEPTETAYGPWAVPMCRPLPSEVVAAWSDDDLIGIPTTADGYAGPVFVSYKITAGDRNWNSGLDWLAVDILGQGDELAIDLTPILTNPKSITNEMVEAIIDRLRDRFGVIRRRWSLRVPIDIGIDRNVGDVVSISSAYLADPAGGLGVTSRFARILSISHDFAGGACDVELIAYAEYGAGWAASYDVYISSISSSTYTLTILGVANATTAEDERRNADLAKYPPILSASSRYYLIQTEGTAAGALSQGYLTAWNVAGRTATYVQIAAIGNPSPTSGFNAILVPLNIPTSQADLFQIGRDRLL